MAEGRIPPVVAYNRLLAMKKVEEPAVDTTATASHWRTLLRHSDASYFVALSKAKGPVKSWCEKRSVRNAADSNAAVENAL